MYGLFAISSREPVCHRVALRALNVSCGKAMTVQA